MLLLDEFDRRVKDKGYRTSRELCRDLEISESHYYKVRLAASRGQGGSAESPPGPKFIANAARVFGVPARTLFRGPLIDALFPDTVSEAS